MGRGLEGLQTGAHPAREEAAAAAIGNSCCIYRFILHRGHGGVNTRLRPPPTTVTHSFAIYSPVRPSVGGLTPSRAADLHTETCPATLPPLPHSLDRCAISSVTSFITRRITILILQLASPTTLYLHDSQLLFFLSQLVS